MSLEAWIFFIVLWTPFVILPGPNAAFVVATGMRRGVADGLVAAAGIAFAAFFHALAACAGLGTVLLAHPSAFVAVKWLGVAYLLWLAVSALRRRDDDPSAPPRAPQAHGPALAARAAFISLTNPKAIVAFMAVLPAFVDTSAAAAPQFAILSLTSLAIAAMVYSAYALAGVWLGKRAAGRAGLARRLIPAGVYGAGALALSLVDFNE